MTELLVYQLTTTPKKKAMPKLLETITARGNKVFIYCSTLERQKEIDDMLWTYEQLSFLPHATIDDPSQEKHSILIGTKLTKANVIFLENFAANDGYSDYEKICIMIDAEDDNMKINNYIKYLNLPTTRFQQNESGGWSKL